MFSLSQVFSGRKDHVVFKVQLFSVFSYALSLKTALIYTLHLNNNAFTLIYLLLQMAIQDSAHRDAFQYITSLGKYHVSRLSIQTLYELFQVAHKDSFPCVSGFSH